MTRDQQVLKGMTEQEPRKSVRAHPERDAQIALFKFLREWQGKYHELAEIYSSMNGVLLGYDSAAKIRAAQAVAAGMLSGVWDIHVPLPRFHPELGGCVHGMYIEMKSAKGKLTEAQERFGATMKRRRYVCVVARTWEEAARAIVDYAGIKNAIIDAILGKNESLLRGGSA